MRFGADRQQGDLYSTEDFMRGQPQHLTSILYSILMGNMTGRERT